MKCRKGFSLIEIILVILLIGILSALAIPRFVNLATHATADSVRAILMAGQSAVMHDYNRQYLQTAKYVSPFPELFDECEEDELEKNKPCDSELEEVQDDGDHEADVIILHQMMGWTPNYPPDFQWHVMWMGSTKRLPQFGARVDSINDGEFIQARDVN